MWVSVYSVLGMSECVSDLLVHFVLLYILLCMRLHFVRNKLYIVGLSNAIRLTALPWNYK